MRLFHVVKVVLFPSMPELNARVHHCQCTRMGEIGIVNHPAELYLGACRFAVSCAENINLNLNQVTHDPVMYKNQRGHPPSSTHWCRFVALSDRIFMKRAFQPVYMRGRGGAEFSGISRESWIWFTCYRIRSSARSQSSPNLLAGRNQTG